MMTGSILRDALVEIEPLRVEETVEAAAEKVLAAGVPALPAVGEDQVFAGIFGEREFMAAAFPGYLRELGSARMVPRTLDEAIELRQSCRDEPIAEYLTRDHIVVDADFSDTQLAEIFLHHDVLIVPILSGGRVRAVVTRGDFFRALVGRLTGDGKARS
jgi:CBS domain-containing protein